MKIKKTFLILALIILLHSFLVIISMNQPFHGDEVVYVECAKGIIETGMPIFDYGIMYPNFQGVWHFPLYSYILSGFVFLFGESMYAVRSVTAIFNLLTIILIYFLTKDILNENEHKEKWALLAVFLYALNPLTIQSSIATDVDGGLLNFSMYLFLYLFFKNKKFYYLIPSLVFCFLVKEIGPPLLFLSIFTFYFITANWKKIPRIFLIFFSSGILYLGIWRVLSYFLDLDFMMSLKHNFNAGRDMMNLSSFFVSIWEFKNFVYFAIPFFIILFFTLTLLFYYKILKKRSLKKIKNQKIILINILALVILAAYFYIGGSAWGFPKYQITALPAMSIFIIYILSKSNLPQNIKELFMKKKKVFLFLILILTIYFLIFIKDPLLPEIETTAVNADLFMAIQLVSQTFLLYIIIPFLICFITFYLSKTKMKFWVTLLFLILFLIVYLNILHVFVNYSTYNKYGDIGVEEVINYFNENNISARNIASHVHIGHYLNMSEYFEISFAYNVPEIFKKQVIENQDIKYIVIWKRDIGRIGENMNYFELDKKIGTYYIYKKI